MTRVAVLGGHGKTGRSVLAALEGRGAVGVPLGRADWPDLAGALRGCDAVYVVAPNLHPDEPAYVAAAIEAARVARVRRIGYHSVASPYAPALPHHVGKAVAEDLVRRSGLAWTILQPGAYLQNLDLTGPVRLAYRAEAPFGFADLREVGEAVATVLLEPGHEGATYELASRRSSVAELAAEAGVEVEVVSPRQWAATDGAALGEREREWLLAMFDYYDRHGLPVGTLPLAALLGRDAEPARRA
ncbi:NAD(P)H-binding protein [Nocardioides sp. dk4132]|uniref:SDR family oxidoreductase n=1 Tax=unclassified Nocardioides TaxID=2615069 RepID=UPI001297E385|nr:MULTISPECIES: NAD(P)H-binding protein [unclassified Nocardioides]MQW75613.1 NAD(P)H-binding protein [Nocardioides sp. dk4132]QGA08514.1 NAD(P)H-binding protein [Nocardioides sp. dk884]